MITLHENDDGTKAEKRVVDTRTTAIQVAVRVRPLDRRELHDGARDMADCYPDRNEVGFVLFFLMYLLLFIASRTWQDVSFRFYF